MEHHLDAPEHPVMEESFALATLLWLPTRHPIHAGVLFALFLCGLYLWISFRQIKKTEIGNRAAQRISLPYASFLATLFPVAFDAAHHLADEDLDAYNAEEQPVEVTCSATSTAIPASQPSLLPATENASSPDLASAKESTSMVFLVRQPDTSLSLGSIAVESAPSQQLKITPDTTPTPKEDLPNADSAPDSSEAPPTPFTVARRKKRRGSRSHRKLSVSSGTPSSSSPPSSPRSSADAAPSSQPDVSTVSSSHSPVASTTSPASSVTSAPTSPATARKSPAPRRTPVTPAPAPKEPHYVRSPFSIGFQFPLLSSLATESNVSASTDDSFRQRSFSLPASRTPATAISSTLTMEMESAWPRRNDSDQEFSLFHHRAFFERPRC